MKKAYDYRGLLDELISRYGNPASFGEKLSRLEKLYLKPKIQSKVVRVKESRVVPKPRKEGEIRFESGVILSGKEHLSRLISKLDEYDEQTFTRNVRRLRDELNKLYDELDDTVELMASINRNIEEFVKNTYDQLGIKNIEKLMEYLIFAGYKKVDFKAGDRLGGCFMNSFISSVTGPQGIIQGIIRYPYQLKYMDEENNTHVLTIKGQCVLYGKEQ